LEEGLALEAAEGFRAAVGASVAAAHRDGGEMTLPRILRNLLMTRWRQNRAFPPETLAAIREAIAKSELQHSGQIRFAVEGALHGLPLMRGQSPRARAVEVFAALHLWDTEHRNGVLIYLLLADRAVEIVVDRALRRQESAHWARICQEMQATLREGRYLEAVLGGIDAVTRVVAEHFPPNGGSHQNLPDDPVVL
jgi:uncharacterized membrane protein